MTTTSANVDAGKSLFAQVQFYIECSKDLDVNEAETLAKLLETNGAVQYPTSTDDRVLETKITHIISATSDFPDYERAVDALKAVVKPEWVEASLLKGRLANPKQYSPDPRLFFTGLVVCCADLPPGDEDAIIGGVLAMGGLYSSPVSRSVTHIVALTMDSEKCQTAVTKNLNCKIVLPHWFDDCLKLRKRIDEGPYCLPDPDILRKKPEDRIPEVGRPDLHGASSPVPGQLPTPSKKLDSKSHPLTVFKKKRVMLSNDLEIGSHLRGTIEDLVVSGGGHVTGSVHKANIFICQYRDSLEYRIASRAGRDVGNLPWLYYLITHNTWTSPLRRLLHYPIAREGLPGFKDFRISLSNYNGEARVYLENVAKAAGGEFTKTMKEDNTHLITAHTVSEKCDAAKEWNVHMINHLWLEESYAKWEIQTLTDSRYTTFPKRTNLGEIVGQTPIDKQAVERYFFPEGSDYDPSSESAKIKKSTYSKDRGHQSSTAVRSDPIPSRTLQPDEPTPRGSKANRRPSEGALLKTPAPSRYTIEGKENQTPSTTGSRSAKDRAAARIHDLAPDIALFEKESKRVGGVIFGGRKSTEDLCSDGSRKRSLSKEDDSSTEADEETRGAKRAKKTKPPATMRLLLSGYKRWVGLAKKEGEDRARLRELGIMLSMDPTNCTHLAAPSIIRTQKFICALAHAPIVLSTDFVDRCLEENKKLPPEQFLLNDPEGEARLDIKLTDATARARDNKGHLLQGYSIYCTESVHGGFDTYKSIVEANGGKCLLYRARAGSSTSRVGGLDGDVNDSASDTPEYTYLLSGVAHDEVRLWPKFRHMAQAMGKTPRIVRTDWMLDLALSQRVNWHKSYELTEDSAPAEE